MATTQHRGQIPNGPRALADPLQRLVARIVQQQPAGPLLDAGSGQGSLASELAQSGFRVTACDIDPAGYQGCASFKKADLNQPLPFRDKTFQYVTCVEVIEHLQGPWQIIREFARVMKPNGLLVLTTPNITSTFSRLKFLFTGTFFCFSPTERESKFGHVNALPYWEIETILQASGFRVEQRTTQRSFGLCGLNTGKARAKRFAVRIAHAILYPFIGPKDRTLLTGDNLVYVCRKE